MITVDVRNDLAIDATRPAGQIEGTFTHTRAASAASTSEPAAGGTRPNRGFGPFVTPTEAEQFQLAPEQAFEITR